MSPDPGAPTPPAPGGLPSEAPDSYQQALDALVERVKAARVRALRSVNHELVSLYWDIGREILVRQEHEGWGAQVVDRLARDLRTLFPDMGMSARNLKYMRAFAKAWPDLRIVQGRLAQLSWSHQIEFKPEYSGKMNFYLAAVDELIKRGTDEPTIGLVLCKGANETVVEYALRDVGTPIQVSEYRTQPLPEPLRQELPAVTEIEAVLRALPMPASPADEGEQTAVQDTPENQDPVG
jgi:hypothetical protein